MVKHSVCFIAPTVSTGARPLGMVGQTIGRILISSAILDATWGTSATPHKSSLASGRFDDSATMLFAMILLLVSGTAPRRIPVRAWLYVFLPTHVMRDYHGD
jgi:hypothetical protein